MRFWSPRRGIPQPLVSILAVWIMLTGALQQWLRKTRARTRSSTQEEYVVAMLQWAVASIGRRGNCNASIVTSTLLKPCFPTASPAVLLLLLRQCAVRPAHAAHAGNVKCGPGISLLQLHPARFLCLLHVLFGFDQNSRGKNRD